MFFLIRISFFALTHALGAAALLGMNVKWDQRIPGFVFDACRAVPQHQAPTCTPKKSNKFKIDQVYEMTILDSKNMFFENSIFDFLALIHALSAAALVGMVVQWVQHIP